MITICGSEGSEACNLSEDSEKEAGRDRSRGGKEMRKLRKLLVVTAAVSLLWATTSVTAGPNETLSGGPITQVKTASGEGFELSFCVASEKCPQFVDAPGVSRTISTPKKRQKASLIIARFQADARCGRLASDDKTTGCDALIILDGQEMTPGDSIFAMTPGGLGLDMLWHSSSIDRSRVVESGVHEVKVQIRGCCDDVLFTIRDWHLTVEVSEVTKPALGLGPPPRSPQGAEPAAGQDNGRPSAQASQTIDVSPDSMSFTTTELGANPPSQSLTIANSGGGTLTFSASGDQSWLQVSPTSGVAPATLSVSAHVADLPAGTYDGEIIVDASGATNARVLVPVTLTVNPTGA